MRIRALLCSALLISGTLLAQQPIPVGKLNGSSKNYRSADGTRLTKNSSDAELEGAINESLTDNPEYRDVRATVNKHRVTLTGDVMDKHVKRLAESDVNRFAGVRGVKNQLKIVTSDDPKRSTLTTEAH